MLIESQQCRRRRSYEARCAFEPRSRNLLLSALPAADFKAIEPDLEWVSIEADARLATAGDRIDAVLFPETGFVSVVDRASEHERIEIGLIGREGLVHFSTMLGIDQSAHDVVAAVGGKGWALGVDRLRALCRSSDAARALFHLFFQTFAVQSARTMSCSLRDRTDIRVARWLLMCHDRIEGDEMPLMHAPLAARLGLRRATVTDALHMLESTRAVRNRRGLIIIRDRAALAAVAGISYGFAERYYSDLIAPFGRGAGAMPTRPEIRTPFVQAAAGRTAEKAMPVAG